MISLDSPRLPHARFAHAVVLVVAAVAVLVLAKSHVIAFVPGAAAFSAVCRKDERAPLSSARLIQKIQQNDPRDQSRRTHTAVELGWDTRLKSASEDCTVAVEDDAGNRDVSTDLSSSSSSSNNNNNSSEPDVSTWAAAELPLSNDQQVAQATSAVWKALADGKSRQILRLSLPLIGATEMDDWPGGDRQRYKACGPMVEKILQGSPAIEGARVVEQILDESDAVGLMQLQCKEPKDDASAMIFPTTDTLSLQKQVTSSAGARLVALVNPAWRSTSDFGLFGAGEAKKALLEFEVTYSLQSLVVYGYTLRLLYCYPGPWRLFLIGEDTGTRELLASWESYPPNQEVEQAVFAKKGRPSATERVRASSKMFQDGM